MLSWKAPLLSWKAFRFDETHSWKAPVFSWKAPLLSWQAFRFDEITKLAKEALALGQED